MGGFNQVVYYMWEFIPTIATVISIMMTLGTFIKGITKKLKQKKVKFLRGLFILFAIVSIVLSVYQKLLVHVPDVTNRTYSEACSTLKNLHLNIKENEDLTNSSALVLSQWPNGNTFVLKGTNIELEVTQEASTVSTTEEKTIPDIVEKYDEDGILLNGSIGVYYGQDYGQESAHITKYDYLQKEFVNFTMEDIPRDYCKIHIHLVNDETNSGFVFTNEEIYSFLVGSNETFYTENNDFTKIKCGFVYFMIINNDVELYCQPGYYRFFIWSSHNGKYYSDKYYISTSGDITMRFKKE